jgi:hypothetical protein
MIDDWADRIIDHQHIGEFDSKKLSIILNSLLEIVVIGSREALWTR